jgi:hypothetical protein
MRPIGCSETSVKKRHYTLRNGAEYCSSHLLRGRSLMSHMDQLYLWMSRGVRHTAVWYASTKVLEENTVSVFRCKSVLYAHSLFIQGKVEAKLSLWGLITQHTMKAHGGVTLKFHAFLTLAQLEGD